MGRIRTGLWCVLLSWLLTAAPGVSHAQSASEDADSRARHLYRNGELLYAEGRYADAIAAWESAYRLSDRPLLLYNIANAQERLGRWEDALNSLNRYRAFAPEDERATLSRRIANIERNLRTREAQVNREQEVPPEDPIEEPEVIERAPAPVVRRQPPVRREYPSSRSKETASSGGIRKAPIALFAISGAGAVTGGIFAYRAHAARAAASASCAGADVVFCPTSAEYALQQDGISSIVADAAFGVALTSAVVGTVMAVKRTDTSNRTTMSLAPAVRGASLGLSSRF